MTQPSPTRLQEFIAWLRSLLHRSKPKPAPKPAPTPRSKPAPKKAPSKPPPIKRITMYDTTEPNTGLPTKNPEAVAGYVGGKWPSYNGLVKRYPHAHHLSIAINAGEDADCLDIENGDATPKDAPGWVTRQRSKGKRRPVVYASVSAMASVLRALNAAHISRAQVRVWTAHYTGKPHLCTTACGFGFSGTADATQYENVETPGHNYDVSETQPGFFS